MLYKWKSIGSLTVYKPKIIWEDDIIDDLKKMKVTNLKVSKAYRSITVNIRTFAFENDNSDDGSDDLHHHQL